MTTNQLRLEDGIRRLAQHYEQFSSGTEDLSAELFDGYTSEITSELNTVSAALFGQLDWAITDRLHLLPGLRLNPPPARRADWGRWRTIPRRTSGSAKAART